MPLIGDRLADLGDDPLGQDRQPVRIGLELAHHHELVAAHPGHEVLFADGAAQQVGGVHQHGIAGNVAERVVDLLETIEVDVEDADAAAMLAAVVGVV